MSHTWQYHHLGQVHCGITLYSMLVYACGINLNREHSQDTKTKAAVMKRLMNTQMTSDPLCENVTSQLFLHLSVFWLG